MLIQHLQIPRTARLISELGVRCNTIAPWAEDFFDPSDDLEGAYGGVALPDKRDGMLMMSYQGKRNAMRPETMTTMTFRPMAK
jgi:hypothetical protein